MAPDGQLVAGRYRLLRTLGTGGLGRVWLAADEMLYRPVAIKKSALPDGLGADEDLVRGLMLPEARAFARVRHPNVIRILDVLPGEDEPWIVMEYLACRTLLQVIQESGALPPARVAAVGLAVLDGLTAASRTGLLHLDVKPANVLICDDGRIVLSDFGPAGTDKGVRALVRAGILLGSPKYIAPERLLGDIPTAQADLWSLGATLYHAAGGPSAVRPGDHRGHPRSRRGRAARSAPAGRPARRRAGRPAAARPRGPVAGRRGTRPAACRGGSAATVRRAPGSPAAAAPPDGGARRGARGRRRAGHRGRRDPAR